MLLVNPWDVDGVWKSSRGGFKHVQLGRFGSNFANEIIIADGKVTASTGATLISVSDEVLQWDSRGESVQWTRLKPQDLDGVWRSSRGGFKHVQQG
eukprot:CAMPEP_0197678164 /NCGR_PEP_ID=MMETSP1338-20131121/89588_1 /TAXON_ID=43686 ORGANISM="Pelagodinium beii, Strain RCC1491" /NCGR_SAMPLE_ID=MMETSP1338 /ASSEMBLY_ACC=CAM_ASM_000754 /LENGTH=95 /DNA_ID=CAMNT_0043259073 /DNA_START=72 /DNA_END=355 /DNA_ORIENTATION=-